MAKDLTAQEFMKNWREEDQSKLPQLSLQKYMQTKFDCEKYLTLSDKERRKLLQLKMFSMFKWHVEVRPIKLCQTFGETHDMIS